MAGELRSHDHGKKRGPRPRAGWPARDAWEAEQIRAALATTGGNKGAAARLLGIKRTTFLSLGKKRCGVRPVAGLDS